METIGKVFARAEKAEARVKELESHLDRYKNITDTFERYKYIADEIKPYESSTSWMLKKAYDQLISLKQEIECKKDSNDEQALPTR
jgi:hypothetical protein